MNIFKSCQQPIQFQDDAYFCGCNVDVDGNDCNADLVCPLNCQPTSPKPTTEGTTADTNATPTGTMTTGTGPVPTVAPWQCAQCLGAYGKCIDESDNGHSTTCYGSSELCLYLTKSTFNFLFCLHTISTLAL